MSDHRLIEEAFPLKQVSLDSTHEKSVRHGHLSTLHMWPARRPLAASRAALIAALLRDPGDEQARDQVNKKIESITHWGTENGPALEFFRQEIRKAFDGRPPRVLDMFAGGGAIPLEAMRLGCAVIANDYNPVAWFILKCTLEFPQRLSGEAYPLPAMPAEIDARQQKQSQHQPLLMWEDARRGTLADHVNLWGAWVLEQACNELARFYPTVNNQVTVAYLWARTVPCPDPACGSEVPLLRTLWLCKKEDKRRALRLLPDPLNRRVDFEIWSPGPRDEVPPGTMAGAKAYCPVCGVNVTADWIKECGRTKHMGARMTAVVVNTSQGKEYRLPTTEEVEVARKAADALADSAARIPYGLPTERQHRNPRTLIVQLYGMETWADLFTPRQLLALVTLVRYTRATREEMQRRHYPESWIEAVTGYLAIVLDKVADYNSSITTWHNSGEKIRQTFGRFALAMAWDFAEVPVTNDVGGAYTAQLEWVARYVEHALKAVAGQPAPLILRQSATEPLPITGLVDTIVTDPPYYDAIPYADLSDFFYVWLRRTVGNLYPAVFSDPVTPKEEELALRLPHTDIPEEHTSAWYEEQMAIAFRRAWAVLVPDGRMVIVFAHKDPQAWQTLAQALIRAGFTVTASWPIDTEMGNRTRAMESAALSSSIWLVCRKRPADAGIGRYGAVRSAMADRITERLRYFWDIGISGPDFVWAAVGAALESYSAYAEVRRIDGTPVTVQDFLREVRGMVADFALHKLLRGRSTEGIDDWTRYYLMHRQYFGMEAAPVGECILLAGAIGLDLDDLTGPRGLLHKAGGDVRLARWDERTREDLGDYHPGGWLPMIDMAHRLIWLWAAGETARLRAYADDHGLGRNDLFWEVAQAVLEMAAVGSRERSLLEALVNWGRAAEVPVARQIELMGDAVS